jgi:hypothetical protein
VAVSRVLEPVSGAVHPPPASHHLFCSGHSLLDDGHLFVAGGHQDEGNALHTFDPDQETWTRVGEMANGRWYPTCSRATIRVRLHRARRRLARLLGEEGHHGPRPSPSTSTQFTSIPLPAQPDGNERFSALAGARDEETEAR